MCFISIHHLHIRRFLHLAAYHSYHIIYFTRKDWTERQGCWGSGLQLQAPKKKAAESFHHQFYHVREKLESFTQQKPWTKGNPFNMRYILIYSRCEILITGSITLWLNLSLHGTPGPAAAWKMQPDSSTGITIKVGRHLKAWNKKSNQIKNKNKNTKTRQRHRM